jgi:hypothetical protein
MTGMSEDEILWDLPLARGLAYMHVSFVLQGTQTQWPRDEADNDEMTNVRKMLQEKPWRKLDI